MVKQVLISFAVLAASVASAETFRVTLVEPSIVKGTELKAGECKFDVKDNAVVIAQGRQKVEVPVTVNTVDKKFAGTRILYDTVSGKYSIKEIQIGGTKTKLTFDSGVQAAGGGQ
ncbi:MAG: hypothetical protein U0Q18_00950 [Bryobacteraceae bacterium]